jgi:molybdenum cofactor guanylyltransferase
MIATTDNTCVLILAGGQGRRMQGEDKGLIRWQGQHLIEYVLKKIQDGFSQVIISANRNIDTYLTFGYPVIEDSISGYQGPLAGLYSAMQSCNEAEYIMVLPCDCPTVPNDLFSRLSEALAHAPDSKIAIADDGNRLQPLFGLYHHSLKATLQYALENDQLKVQGFISELGYVTADYSDQSDAFKNFNKPEDLI